MIPEQAWENADLPATAFRYAAPECASIGFVNGKAVGSASPLTWSACILRPAVGQHPGGSAASSSRPNTVDRYINNTQQGIDVTLTSPANNSLVNGLGDRDRHHNTDATVDITAINVDIDGAFTTATTTADAAGAFSIDLPVPPRYLVHHGRGHSAERRDGLRSAHRGLGAVPGTLLFECHRPRW